jgi:hypothetical protein
MSRGAAPLALAAVAIALAALAGCGAGGGTTAPADMTRSAVAEILLGGTAADGSGFVPMGGDQTLVPGSQGGFHVWLKYRVAGMPIERLKVHRETRRVDDHALILLTDGTQEVGAPGPDGYWELPTALPSFMCPTPLGITVIDQRVVFTVDIASPGGEPLAHGTAEATVRCPTTGSDAEFCARICSG